MFTLYIVTSNKHKLEEYYRMLKASPLANRVKLEMVPVEVVEREEGELVFHRNSYLKAMKGFEVTGSPTFADDSGLVIPALEGLPGPKSARFLFELPQSRKNEFLSKALSTLPPTYRRALFTCVITLIISKEMVVSFEARTQGSIASTPSGEKGFGYDPIFVPDGSDRTFAQMLPEEKDKLSHRGKAFRMMLDFLRTYIRERD